jgi:hypothetical protein
VHEDHAVLLKHLPYVGDSLSRSLLNRRKARRAEPGMSSIEYSSLLTERSCRAMMLRPAGRAARRTACATRFADCGATVPQLMAWFGWKTPAEAIRYVESADRRKAAKAAADKLRERKRTTEV